MSELSQPPSIPLLPHERQAIEPLLRQLLPLQSQLNTLTNIIIGRAGDPSWDYSYDIRSKSLVPKSKKVTVTLPGAEQKEAKNGD